MFNTLEFSWPPTLDDIASDSTAALENAASELDAAGDRLGDAPALTIENNPVAAEASGSAVNYSALMNIISTDVKMVCIHPWTQGVGQGESHFRYLSPANAIQAAANKLVDMPDFNRQTTTMDAIVLIVSAKSFDLFSATLKQFTNVFPLPDLLMCQRRAGQLSTVEKDKVLLPNAAINARWRWKGVGGIGLSRNASNVVGELCSHAVGYESGALSPDDEIQNLITKKTSAIDAAKDAVTDMQSIFSGSVGRGVFFSGQTAAQIKNALDTSGLSHDDPLACCVVFTAVPGKLALVKEVLGL
jgi:hypothetical protein